MRGHSSVRTCSVIPCPSMEVHAVHSYRALQSWCTGPCQRLPVLSILGCLKAPDPHNRRMAFCTKLPNLFRLMLSGGDHVGILRRRAPEGLNIHNCLEGPTSQLNMASRRIRGNCYSIGVPLRYDIGVMCSSLPKEHHDRDNKALREKGIWVVSLATARVVEVIDNLNMLSYAWQCLSADLASEMACCSEYTVDESWTTGNSTPLERVDKVQNG